MLTRLLAAALVLLFATAEAEAITGRATYQVEVAGYTAYATPTDMICITGSDTTVVRVLILGLKITTTAAAVQTLHFVKRTTANIGGTETNPTPVKLDSAQVDPSAVIRLYSAAPATLGTATPPNGGTFAITLVNSVATGGAGGLGAFSSSLGVPTTVSYSDTVILHGAAESVCVNYNGQALTAGWLAQWLVQWTEE